MSKIYEAQLVMYLRALDKRVGLKINCKIGKLMVGIKRLLIYGDTEGGISKSI